MKVVIETRKVSSNQYVNVELVVDGDLVKEELHDKEELIELAAEFAYAAYQIAEAAK